jgi:hypothetical protein
MIDHLDLHRGQNRRADSPAQHRTAVDRLIVLLAARDFAEITALRQYLTEIRVIGGLIESAAEIRVNKQSRNDADDKESRP